MVTIYLSNGIFSLSMENTCQKSGKIKKKLSTWFWAILFDILDNNVSYRNAYKEEEKKCRGY